MPCLWKHINLLCFDSLQKLEVRVAELEIVEGELDSNEVEGEVVRGELAIVRWPLSRLIQSTEEVLHETLRSLHLLVDTCLLSDRRLNPRSLRILLSFEICLLCIADQQLCHMVDYHADPLAVHDFEAADSVEVPVALLEGLEDFTRVACRLPSLLLV